MLKLNKTYEVISEESASHGDFEETGFEYKDEEFESIDDVVQELLNTGATSPSSSEFHKGLWYSTIDPDRCYKTGNETYYSIHLSQLAEAQQLEVYNRIVGID